MLIVSETRQETGRNGWIWGTQYVIGEVKLSLRVIFISTSHHAMVKRALSRFRTRTYTHTCRDQNSLQKERTIRNYLKAGER